jgi:cytochrome P450 family 3 subfamily A
MLKLLEDEKWKRVRSIMSPTFSTGKLRRMRPLIEECLNTLIHNLENVSKSGKESDMKRLFGAFSMEVVIQVAFGTKVNALIDENNPIILNARKIFNINVSPKIFIAFLAPKLARLLKITIFDMNVTEFFKEFTLQIINERRKSKNKEKRVDFLQLMLDAIENNTSDNFDEEDNDQKFDDKVDEKYSELKNIVPPNKSKLYLCLLCFPLI